MVWPAAIGAAAQLGSSLLGGLFSAKGAKKQNAAALAAAQAQMDFQREMYGSRYQMTMADMKAAGLNPILAYQQGVGSSPGGASYSPVNVGAAGVSGAVGAGEALGAGLTSALSTRRLQQELRNMREMENKTAEEAKTARSLGWRHDVEGALARERQKTEQETQKNIREQNRALKYENYLKYLDYKFFSTETGKTLRDVDRIGRALNPFASTMSSGASSARSIRGR